MILEVSVGECFYCVLIVKENKHNYIAIMVISSLQIVNGCLIMALIEKLLWRVLDFQLVAAKRKAEPDPKTSYHKTEPYHLTLL